MKHAELTSRIIALCIKVHSELGPGLLESVYEQAIAYELLKHDIGFKRQQGIEVMYDDVSMGIGFKADLIIENIVIVEIKSVDNVTPVFCKILLTYLRLSQIEVGLLINFNVLVLRDGITRLVLDKRRKVT